MKKSTKIAIIAAAALLEMILLLLSFAPVSSVSREQEEAGAKYAKNPTDQNKQELNRVFSTKNAQEHQWQYLALATAIVLPPVTFLILKGPVATADPPSVK